MTRSIAGKLLSPNLSHGGGDDVGRMGSGGATGWRGRVKDAALVDRIGCDPLPACSQGEGFTAGRTSAAHFAWAGGAPKCVR